MKNLKKVICALLGAALLMSMLAPAAFAEDEYVGMNTDKVLAIEKFSTSAFPAKTLCVALSGEYIAAGESVGISICTVGAEGQLETVHTYSGDEMLIQYPCAENGNRLELFLRSESLPAYDLNYVLCIAEGSFMSTAGGNERIEYKLNSIKKSSMGLELNSGVVAYDEEYGYRKNIYVQDAVLYVRFNSDFFGDRGGITLMFDKEGVASASNDGSFTLSGVGWTNVTAKLNDFIYEEIVVTSLTVCQAKFAQIKDSLSYYSGLILLIVVGPLIIMYDFVVSVIYHGFWWR